MFNRRALFLLGCAILGAAALLFRLGRPPIVTSHEARLAETAVTMARSGLPWAAQSVSVDLGVDRPHLQAVNPWLIPVYEGGARLQKPPLPYWCAAAVFLVLGPSEFAARLPSAMMGMAGIFLVYGFVRELAGRRTARFAALVWVSTLFVVDEYHKAMADPYLAFFTLIALWTWMRLCRSAGPPRPVLSQRLPWVAAFYLAVALALLAKGPVALLLIAGFIAVGVFVGRRRPRLEWSAHAGGVVLVMAITLPWVLYVVMTVPRVLEVWRFESVGEFADNVRNARPWFFYLGAVFQVSLPWTALWLAGLWLALRRPRRAMLAPILWMACMIVILIICAHEEERLPSATDAGPDPDRGQSAGDGVRLGARPIAGSLAEAAARCPGHSRNHLWNRHCRAGVDRANCPRPGPDAGRSGPPARVARRQPRREPICPGGRPCCRRGAGATAARGLPQH